MLQASNELIARTFMSAPVSSFAARLRQALRNLSMSRANYRLAYVIDFACAAAFGYLGLRASTAWYAVAGVLLGAFAFTLVEYAMHRWLFHGDFTLAGELHASHHDDAKQPTALPFWSSCIAAPLLSWSLTHVVSVPLSHWILCGFFVAYFSYGVLHHLQHTIRIKDVPFRCLRRRWIAHAVHHGRVGVNFGVTTSFWDRIFGTYLAPKR